MLNMRRVPGLLYTYKRLWLTLSGLIVALTCSLLYWGVICTDVSAWRHVKKLCTLHYLNAAVGTLCHPLCVSREINSPSCQTFTTEKEAVFTAQWRDSQIVFKKVKDIRDESKHVYWIDELGDRIFPSEDEFHIMIRRLITDRFNASISQNHVVRMSRLNPLYEEKDLRQRRIEIINIWTLLQNNEYLCSLLYSERDAFPQLIGTCGNYFAVEYIEPLQKTSSLLALSDTREDWSKQVKLSLTILEFLDELETGFIEPFHLCDVRLHHFGFTKSGNRLKFLDLDMVYPKSVINKLISSKGKCDSDNDCDFHDCRSRCNLDTRRCENSVTNNNLQVICEKIFLGWTNPHKVIVPGLLMTQHTPSSLASLLRQCANPSSEPTKPRDSASEEIKKKLENVLSEMEQELAAELFD